MHGSKMNKRGLWVIAAIVVLTGGYYALVGPDNQPTVSGPAVVGTAIAVVKVPSELSPEAKIGQTAYNTKCMQCHGANAEGQKEVAPPLVHKIYVSGHHGDMAFVLAAQNGVRSHHWPFGNMPPVEGLTRADVLSIVSYVRELQRENGID